MGVVASDPRIDINVATCHIHGCCVGREGKGRGQGSTKKRASGRASAEMCCVLNYATKLVSPYPE